MASRRQPLGGGAEPGDPSEVISAAHGKGVVLKLANREELTSVKHGATVNMKLLLIDDAAPALDMTSPLLSRRAFAL